MATHTAQCDNTSPHGSHMWLPSFLGDRHRCEGVVRWVPDPEPEPEPNPVNHPPHYTSHPSGVECIDITEHYNFNVGNAIKYLWRAGLKGNELEDLEKAAWYVNREIERRKRG